MGTGEWLRDMPETPGIMDRLSGTYPTISVGMMTADLSSIGTELRRLDGTGVPVVHFDVMDGDFCPMMTFGPPIVKAARTSLLKDVHLMVSDPLDKLPAFVDAGADILTIHAEACRDPHYVLQEMKKMRDGLARGVALCPGTPTCVLEPLLDEVEMIVLLAVHPGRSGQSFIRSTARRMEAVLKMIAESHRPILTCIDGGISKKNIDEVARMGADIIVTGSAVFDGKAVEDNARFMLAAAKSARK